MYKAIVFSLLFGCTPLFGNPIFKITDSVENALSHAVQQYHLMHASLPMNSAVFPRFESPAGVLKLVNAGDWTSGFYPGILWYLYQYSADTTIRRRAIQYTEYLKGQQTRKGDHDIGFIINSSYGNYYKLTHRKHIKSVISTSSLSLATRYNPTVKSIKSWDWFKPYPVIIDNMMNLELLYRGFDCNNDSSLLTIATNHALNSSYHHIRADSSTFHVVDYDKTTGNVNWQGTRQGFADSSTWSRGQAWGIYGFTMMYKETGNVYFLEQANKLLGYFISRLPEDGVPFYDFNAPNIPNEPRDVSASAITASALIDLYALSDDTLYLRWAEKMILSMSSPEYTASLGTNLNFVLKHVTGGYNYQVDSPHNYGDYYYIEALVRYYLLSGATLPNHKPEITEYIADTGYLNIPYSWTPVVFDYENDSIVLTANNLPSGLDMDVDGTIHGLPTSSGKKYFDLIAYDGAFYDTTVIEINILATNSVHQPLQQNNNIVVYPNPFSQSLYVSNNLSEEPIVKISIFDVTGRKLNEISFSEYLKDITLTELVSNIQSNGVFICEIEYKNDKNQISKIYQRIIKQKK